VKRPSHRFSALLVGLVLSLIATSVVAATPPKPGANCAKLGISQSYKGTKYTCVKRGLKRVWDKGVPEKKAVTTPTPSASPTTSPDIRTYAVQMEKSYLPQAPSMGWDDYRCFLLDPKMDQDSIIRSIQFIPEQKDYVHHAIIFRVTATDLPEANEKSKGGAGWPCFGGSGLGGMFSTFVSSPWISSWAPGRGKDSLPNGYGIPFKKGEQFVLQVHYNLLASQDGKIPRDQSKIVMEAVPADGSSIQSLEIELLPAPVELACPAGVTGPLCDRGAALRELAARTNNASIVEVIGIGTICGQNPLQAKPSLISTCDKVVSKPYTVIAAAAHMHLLGKKMKITLNPGTSREQIILNETEYDFDNQAPIYLPKPVTANSGDVLRVECTYDPTIRQRLPILKSQPPRYITWGEGSSDEMCLGVLSVTK